MPTTSFNKESAKSALASMQSVMPQENELNNAFTPTIEIITPISTEHDSFLKDYITSIESGGEIYTEYEGANTDYNKLLQNLSDTIATMENMDQNGEVSGENEDPFEDQDDEEFDDEEFDDEYDYYGGSTYSGGPTYSGGENPNQTTSQQPTDIVSNDKETEIDDLDENGEESYLDESVINTPTVTIPPVTKEETTQQNNSNTDTSTNLNDSSVPTEIITGVTTGTTTGDSNGVNTVVGAGTAAVVANAFVQPPANSPTVVEESGVPYKDDNAFGSYNITKEGWNSLSDEEREKVKSKLKSLGYTDSEIEAILNGGGSVSKLSLDAVAKTLEEAIKTNPGLREEIKSRYGLDVFNSDGSVNKDKLGIALLMDNAKAKDNYSLINLLHNNYDIDVVESSLYNDLTTRLEKHIAASPSLRQKLIDRYGFDIFNEDGTINRDKLTLAILMDNQNSSDEYDLTRLLDELFGAEQENIPVVSNPQVVKIETPQEPTKKKSSNALPVLLGLGVAGAAAGGGIYLAKKKKEEEENEEDDDITFEEDTDYEDKGDTNDEDSLLVNSYEARPEGKKWLHGLGVNLDADEQSLEREDYDRAATSTSSDLEEQFISEAVSNEEIDKVKPKYAEKEEKENILPYIGVAAGAGLIGKETYDRLKEKDEDDDDDDNSSDNKENKLEDFMG